jgi:hypothetical protein
MAQAEAAAVNQEANVRVWLEFAEADRRSAYNAMKAADYRDVAFHFRRFWNAWSVSGNGLRRP